MLRKKHDPANDGKITEAEKALETLKKTLADLQKGEKDKNIVKALDAASGKGMNTSLTKKIKELDVEITRLRGHLAESNTGFQRGVNTIVGVEEMVPPPAAAGGTAPTAPPVLTQEGFKCVMSDEQQTGADKNLLTGGAQPPLEPDPWTRIVFNSSNEETESDSSEKSMSAEAKVKIGGFFASVEASTRYSSAAKYDFLPSSPHPFCSNGTLTVFLGNCARSRRIIRLVVPCKSFAHSSLKTVSL